MPLTASLVLTTGASPRDYRHRNARKRDPAGQPFRLRDRLGPVPGQRRCNSFWTQRIMLWNACGPASTCSTSSPPLPMCSIPSYRPSPYTTSPSRGGRLLVTVFSRIKRNATGPGVGHRTDTLALCCSLTASVGQPGEDHALGLSRRSLEQVPASTYPLVLMWGSGSKGLSKQKERWRCYTVLANPSVR